MYFTIWHADTNSMLKFKHLQWIVVEKNATESFDGYKQTDGRTDIQTERSTGRKTHKGKTVNPFSFGAGYKNQRCLFFLNLSYLQYITVSLLLYAWVCEPCLFLCSFCVHLYIPMSNRNHRYQWPSFEWIKNWVDI